MPYVIVKVTQPYEDPCVQNNAKRTIESRLREYETVAAQYTKDGTPAELQVLMGQTKELADELHKLDDNNVNNKSA